ncbi:MAG TPA: ribbon-helix-helix protein, CopG family [Thermoanaerobaculia bacterium]|nr:ribbon-helix-helix protein, CopG family [Thermoanaerobaculia bacterium]
MKTAVSIPDPVFDAAEELAHRLGLSRSELYSRALREYLDDHLERSVTARLDAVYASQGSQLDSDLARLQTASLPREDW